MRVLDACVVAYAAAHTCPFGKLGASRQPHSIEIPHSEKPRSTMGYFLVRRRLCCLDKFLQGSKVWVLHRLPSTASVVDLESLDSISAMLETDASILADIWGPMFMQIATKEHLIFPGTRVESKPILRYRMGAGSIVPWKQTDSFPGFALEPNEVFCHWLPDDRQEEFSTSGVTLDGTERLIIGADPRFRVNSGCATVRAGAANILQRFRASGSLRHPVHTPSHDELDAKNRGINFGFTKIVTCAVSITNTWKRFHGTTYKDDLISDWAVSPTPGTVARYCNPSVLERLRGVEMSCCTENMRRVSIAKIILSDAMRPFILDNS